ncbi:diguanylate cyclase [Deinococcus sp. SM5_A1]|uniref:histidine kinase N-terminal 7TM domain-containing diguanylate cyclase n=1 Tax=Deinococcus sp. SM5_A1 TaxID=3379094 RepID=UPI00385A148F
MSTLAQTYMLWLNFAGALALMTAAVAWRRREVPGALGLFAYLMMVAFWTLTYAAHWGSSGPLWPQVWLLASFVGAVSSPVCVWLLTRLLTAPSRKVRWPEWTAVLAVSMITVALLVTNDPLGLLFGPVAGLGTAHTLLSGGPWFTVAVVHGYLLILLSVVRLIRARRESVGLYRQQVSWVLLGLTVPWAGSFVGVMWGPVFPELDITPMSFLVTGAVFLYAVLGLRLFDLVPVARHLLIEQLPDGVVVLDRRRRVLDLNQAARRMVGNRVQSPLGLPAAEVFGHWSAALHDLRDLGDQQLRLALPGGRHLEVRVSSLRDDQQVVQGHMVVWRDVTEQQRAEARIQAAHEELQQRFHEIQRLQVQLREQSLRDPLTGLHNRRYLQKQLALLETDTGAVYSVLIFDIDHFKVTNDTYGHGGGDRALQEVAALLQRRFQDQHTLCRYGGEEFVMVLTGLPAAQVQSVAETIRRDIEGLDIYYDGQSLRITASFGVATAAEHGPAPEQVLLAADRALYLAKNQGRNRVCMSPPGPWLTQIGVAAPD